MSSTSGAEGSSSGANNDDLASATNSVTSLAIVLAAKCGGVAVTVTLVTDIFTFGSE